MPQGRSEGTSSVAFEILIINCQIDFIKFVYLQLFNVQCKFLHLQLFDVKFLFSENYIFRKQERTAVYGRTSLVWNCKLVWKNDDLKNLKNLKKLPGKIETQINFWGTAPCARAYQNADSSRRYQTNLVQNFLGTWSVSALRYNHGHNILRLSIHYQISFSP